MALPRSSYLWAGAIGAVSAVAFVLDVLGYVYLSAGLLGLLGTVLGVAVGIGYLDAAPHVRRPRALIATAITISVFTITRSFSAVYLELSRSDIHAFTEPLSAGDSWYFTLTVLTTTGFGDIHAKSTEARLAVSLQMAVGIVLGALILTRLASLRSR